MLLTRSEAVDNIMLLTGSEAVDKHDNVDRTVSGDYRDFQVL
jgi:hypothetical protein